MNIKGDDLLTTHNRTNQSSTLFCIYYFLSALILASCSSLPSTSLRQRAQGPRGGQADLGQPIATVLPERVPLRSSHRRVLHIVLSTKLSLRCVCYVSCSSSGAHEHIIIVLFLAYRWNTAALKNHPRKGTITIERDYLRINEQHTVMYSLITLGKPVFAQMT